MAYQLVKRGKELRRDAEHHLVGIHNAKEAGHATTARETASYAHVDLRRASDCR
jgi:hypothetical protein